MNQVSCQACSRSITAAEAFEVNGKICCGPCAESEAQLAKVSGQPVDVSRYVDKSICARCNTYIGQGGGVAVGTVRLCFPCSQLVENCPYPQWLKLSLAAMLLLLVFALSHGRKYFQAGMNLYRGEQLVERGDYQKALPYLTATLKIAANSDKGALLAAKAAILSGDMQVASQALEGHNGGRFDDAGKPDFQEVNRLWTNANAAFAKLEQAAKLDEQDGNEVAASKLAHEAAAMYPQFSQMTMVVDHYDEGVAFVNKDYDQFYALAEKDWKVMPVASSAAAYSSALACKYAITGDVSYRQRSEEMLAKAKELAKDNKQARSSPRRSSIRNSAMSRARQSELRQTCSLSQAR